MADDAVVEKKRGRKAAVDNVSPEHKSQVLIITITRHTITGESGYCIRPRPDKIPFGEENAITINTKKGTFPSDMLHSKDRIC
ncbi:hypothetical protein J6590_041031 [Homalodisca vitripennis]|nr:hypothetical protein J6590_041031 [Homalodisca vitripennis]